MKHNQIVAFGVVAAMGLGLAACGQKSTSNKASQTLNVTLPDEPATVDPNTAYDTNSASMILQTMEGLYKYDQHNKLVPGVATKVVKPTNHGKTYTFTLRRDAKWSNGDPVTAQDFVTSFRRTVDPKTKAQFASVYQYFKNFNAVQKGKLSPTKLGVKALGPHKLQVQLTRAVPYFNDLAASKYLPLDTKVVKKYGLKYGTNANHAVYDGPYKLTGWTGTNSSWRYVKNPDYYNAGKVKMKRVNVTVAKDQNTGVNLFKSDKVQETTVTGQYVRENKNDPQMKTHLLGRINYLYFNNQKKLTNSTNLRQAMSYIIDRRQLTQNVLQDGSKPALSAVPLGDQTNPATGQDMAKEVGNLLPHNVKKAKQYWQAYLKEIGKKKVTLNLLTDDTDEDKHVGQYIQSAAEKALKGLNVQVTSLPHAQHVSRDFAGNFEMNLTGWSTNWLDASDFLGLARDDNSVNFTHWKDAKFDQLAHQADNLTGESRYKKLVAADQRLMAVKGYVPLYQPSEAKLISKKIGGLNYSLLNEAQYQYAYWK
ncbi:peptide ABC transporter substrate-binding protein [Lentilactobacillus raoultii]|uniref:Peptide ABC transporter substrate-binding protein n=1 Tax=Lentilactobacillus raoultii TaxID=1987503 RepID=A0ABW3PG76_9LACO|nr:peptide ABC transporter substrate-binding protein [Lentilactobacillus raoultii]